MAEAVNIQCGFCLNEKDLDNPKSLPCEHVHCQPCLAKNHSIYGVLRCPWCREVYDVTVDSLPSANQETDNSIFCDVCKRKGKDNQPASTYCTFCRKLYCFKHQESHDDSNEEHQRMTMSEYRTQAKRLERRVCPRHTGFSYSLGCSMCTELFCVQCIPGIGQCDSGSVHQLTTVDDLVKEITPVDELFTKEDKVSALFKQVSKLISDFDTETEDLLEILHKQRDEQLSELKLRYEKLEAKFLANRTKTKSDLTRYMEEEVGTLWSNLSKSRMKIEAQLKQSHQVDIVKEHSEIKGVIQKILSAELSKLELDDVKGLKIKGEKRDIEVEVVSTTSIYIGTDQADSSPPKSITLLETVPVSTSCIGVRVEKGNTYVGLYGTGVDRIDENYSLTKSFISIKSIVSGVTGNINGVTVYKDRLYTLAYITKDNWMVSVHDFSGTRITNWTHVDNSTGFNKLVVLDDKVVVPDRLNKQLTLYSLTGEVIKYISCPLLANGVTAICAADEHCVIISDYESSRVFKQDLVTEEVVWTSEEVPEPQGVTCYKNRYVLVANRASETTIWVLDARTCSLMSKLTDPTVRSESRVLDLHISGDTLVVPRYDEKKVLFCQLNSK